MYRLGKRYLQSFNVYAILNESIFERIVKSVGGREFAKLEVFWD